MVGEIMLSAKGFLGWNHKINWFGALFALLSLYITEEARKWEGGGQLVV